MWPFELASCHQLSGGIAWLSKACCLFDGALRVRFLIATAFLLRRVGLPTAEMALRLGLASQVVASVRVQLIQDMTFKIVGRFQER